jgi:hypothetical protein
VKRHFELGEKIKDTGEHFGRTADARIANADGNEVVLESDRERDSAAFRRILGRVIEQVAENLFKGANGVLLHR